MSAPGNSELVARMAGEIDSLQEGIIAIGKERDGAKKSLALCREHYNAALLDLAAKDNEIERMKAYILNLEARVGRTRIEILCDEWEPVV